MARLDFVNLEWVKRLLSITVLYESEPTSRASVRPQRPKRSGLGQVIVEVEVDQRRIEIIRLRGQSRLAPVGKKLRSGKSSARTRLSLAYSSLSSGTPFCSSVKLMSSTFPKNFHVYEAACELYGRYLRPKRDGQLLVLVGESGRKGAAA